MPRVIHTAQALVDMVVQVPSLPRRGGNVMAPPATSYAGGAVNILLAAARSGAEAVHAGAIGTGPNGDLIREALEAEGVACSAPPVQGVDTAVCVVLVEPTAERTFVTTMAAERRVTFESLSTADPQPGDLVCVSGYSLFEPTRDPLVRWLESLPDGVVVVLDPGAPFASMPQELRERVLAVTDVWTSNAEEAAELAGTDDLEHSIERVADLLATSAHQAVASPRMPGTAVVIVRDGPRGCWVREESATTYMPGFPQTPVDTNGAGDAHTGALVARRALGEDWLSSARWANAAAAIKVTRRGPATAPTATEVQQFLESTNGGRTR
ncbi:MAG: PfkB family carbohydrate kinase [bacterium]|nr:PfkB family carbohydrate kinase [bacterium]